MATLLQLCEQNQLVHVDPQFGTFALELRSIYLLPNAMQWLENSLHELLSDRGIEITPAEQVDALVSDFCSGKPLTIGWQFKNMKHHADGVWELKTPDVRTFGWFALKDVFIASAAHSANHIKQHNLYHGFCMQTQRDRLQLNLDDPKFIPGDDPNAVVSNWIAPA